MKLVSSIYFGFHKREDVFCISRLTQRRVISAENDFDLSPCNTTDLTSEENICVNTFSTIPPNTVVRCLSVNDPICTCNTVFFDRNPRDREGCTVVVSTSTPTSAPVINERLDGIKLQLKKSDTNVPKSSSIRAGLLEDGMDVECLSYDEFRDVCENSESCSPNVIRLLEDSFRIYASVRLKYYNYII
mmetsp:Transcript_27140/g.43632  ORF Transcript_27140/g.43632 Transcript_27140/m.43632 type:complete len:188 (+) Transcript_27140:36-599(+)